MPLSADDVAHVAMLARLGLSAEERTRFAAQLDAILEHISRLNDVDTASVEETTRVGSQVNVWRDDEPAPSMDADTALRGAPDREGRYFRVGAIQE